MSQARFCPSCRRDRPVVRKRINLPRYTNLADSLLYRIECSVCGSYLGRQTVTRQEKLHPLATGG